MWNAGRGEAQAFGIKHLEFHLVEAQAAGIKIARRNINNLRYANDITLMPESKQLKSLLMKVKEENEKLA